MRAAASTSRISASLWTVVTAGGTSVGGADWMFLVVSGMVAAALGTFVEATQRPVSRAPTWIALAGFGGVVVGCCFGLVSGSSPFGRSSSLSVRQRHEHARVRLLDRAGHCRGGRGRVSCQVDRTPELGPPAGLLRPWSVGSCSWVVEPASWLLPAGPWLARLRSSWPDSIGVRSAAVRPGPIPGARVRPSGLPDAWRSRSRVGTTRRPGRRRLDRGRLARCFTRGSRAQRPKPRRHIRARRRVSHRRDLTRR